MSKSCKNCFYYDKCPSEEACEDYVPLKDEDNDEIVDELIETNRDEFRNEWFQYIKENND